MRRSTMSKYPAAFKERAVTLAVASEQPIAQTARERSQTMSRSHQVRDHLLGNRNTAIGLRASHGEPAPPSGRGQRRWSI